MKTIEAKILGMDKCWNEFWNDVQVEVEKSVSDEIRRDVNIMMGETEVQLRRVITVIRAELYAKLNH